MDTPSAGGEEVRVYQTNHSRFLGADSTRVNRVRFFKMFQNLRLHVAQI